MCVLGRGRGEGVVVFMFYLYCKETISTNVSITRAHFFYFGAYPSQISLLGQSRFAQVQFQNFLLLTSIRGCAMHILCVFIVHILLFCLCFYTRITKCDFLCVFPYLFTIPMSNVFYKMVPELQKRRVKVASIDTTCVQYSLNPMFDHVRIVRLR